MSSFDSQGVREIYGIHTCDLRRTKTDIAAKFPMLDFEPGFEEEDPYWKPDEREAEGPRRRRLRAAMFKLFGEDKNTCQFSVLAVDFPAVLVMRGDDSLSIFAFAVLYRHLHLFPFLRSEITPCCCQPYTAITGNGRDDTGGGEGDEAEIALIDKGEDLKCIVHRECKHID